MLHLSFQNSNLVCAKQMPFLYHAFQAFEHSGQNSCHWMSMSSVPFHKQLFTWLGGCFCCLNQLCSEMFTVLYFAPPFFFMCVALLVCGLSFGDHSIVNTTCKDRLVHSVWVFIHPQFIPQFIFQPPFILLSNYPGSLMVLKVGGLGSLFSFLIVFG